MNVNIIVDCSNPVKVVVIKIRVSPSRQLQTNPFYCGEKNDQIRTFHMERS